MHSVSILKLDGIGLSVLTLCIKMCFIKVSSLWKPSSDQNKRIAYITRQIKYYYYAKFDEDMLSNVGGVRVHRNADSGHRGDQVSVQQRSSSGQTLV